MKTFLEKLGVRITPPSRRCRCILAAMSFPFAATLLQWLLWDYVEPFSWFFYYPAALAAALVGGRCGGITATLISALLGYYGFIPSEWTFNWQKISALTSTGMFTFMGIAFSFFAQRMHDLMKRAAQRESEERFTTFMAALPAHAWVKDDQGRYVYANNLLQQEVMVGIEDYKGLTDLDFFPRDIANELRNNDQTILSGGRPLAFSEQTRSAEGTTRHWQTVKFPFVDAEKRRCVGGIAFDITQTKQAEEALRQARAALELAQEAAGSGTWDWDMNTGKLHWSQQMCHIFGLDPAQAEASFDTWRSVLHEKDRDHAEKKIEEAIQKHTRLDSTYRIVFPTGAVRWIHALGNTIYNEDGTAKRMTGICLDITEHKCAEEAAQREKEKLQALVDSIPDEIWVADAEGNLVLANPAVQSEFGVAFLNGNVAEVAGRAEAYRADGSPRPVEEAPPLRALKGEVVRGEEEIVRIPSRGELRYRQVNALPMKDAHGAVIGSVAVVRDITDLKRAEAHLRESRDQLNATLESIADGFMACDADWRYVYMNSRAESVLGTRREEALGRTCWEVFPSIVSTLAEVELRAAASGEIRDFEYFYEPLNRWFHVRCFPRRGGGISAHFMDITDRKAAEAAVQASEERYRLLAENTEDLVSLEDIEGRHLYISPSYYRVTGWTPEDMEGSDWRNRMHAEDLPQIESCKSAARSGRSTLFEHRICCRDNHWIWVEQRYQSVLDKTGQVSRVLLSARDITKRKQAEADLQRLNRTLRMIDQCNRILVRAINESDLLQAICRVVVENGSYRMAWVGTAEHDEAKSVCPVAQAGFVQGYLDNLCITWADSERGCGPTGRAIRTGQPVVARNLLTDPTFAPWREAAIQRGYAASASLPLKREQQVLGALMVYAAEPNTFDTAEVALLQGLADNIAFGITAVRTRLREQQVREELHLLSGRLLQVQDQERRRLARELHDTTAQHLAALTLKLGDLRDFLAQAPDFARGLCEDCLNLARQSAQEIRTQSYLLHPPLLEVLGLIEAVDDYIQGFSARCGIKVELKVSERFGRLPSDVELALFRVVQESLSNVFRHSRSPQAEIRFTRSASAVKLEVRDAGQGIPADMLKRIKDLKSGLGVGLGGIHERLRHLGGQLELESGSTGTTVRAILPMSGNFSQEAPTT